MLDVVVYWLQLEGRILCLIVVCIWDIMMRYGNFDCAVLFLMVVNLVMNLMMMMVI